MADGTAQHVMDKMSEAASSGLSKMSKLTHIRVVQEGDLNTDKESLFSGAPGSKVLVKLAAGVEKIKSKLGGGKDKDAVSKDGGGEDIYGSISDNVVVVTGQDHKVKVCRFTRWETPAHTCAHALHSHTTPPTPTHHPAVD